MNLLKTQNNIQNITLCVQIIVYKNITFNLSKVCFGNLKLRD